MPSHQNDVTNSLTLINNYRVSKNAEWKFDVRMDANKGRIIVSTAEFECGDTVMVESPLQAVAVDEENEVYQNLLELSSKNNFSLAPLWYWCALNSVLLKEDEEFIRKLNLDHLTLTRIPKITQSQLLTLFSPQVTEGSAEAKVLMDSLELGKYCTPLKFEKLLQAWIHNCFEHTYDPLGYAVYFMPSFSSHSCVPNCTWAYDADNNYVLRARSLIRFGDELTISYISENDLYCISPARQRIMELTKAFTCTCPRCTADADLSRGLRCPFCEDGEVFLSPNAGTARDESDIRSFVNPSGGDFEPFDSGSCDRALGDLDFFEDIQDLEFYVNLVPKNICLSCHKGISVAQRNQMLAKEQILIHHVKNMYRQYVSNSHDEEDEDDDDAEERESYGMRNSSSRHPRHSTYINSAESDVPFSSVNFEELTPDGLAELVNNTVTQHEMRCAMYSILSVTNSQKESYRTAISYLQRKYTLLKRMYPGLTASLGWCLEEIADQYAKAHRRVISSNPCVNGEKDEDPASSAMENYDHALRLLRTMFGDRHEYCTDVEAKKGKQQETMLCIQTNETNETND